MNNNKLATRPPYPSNKISLKFPVDLSEALFIALSILSFGMLAALAF